MLQKNAISIRRPLFIALLALAVSAAFPGVAHAERHGGNDRGGHSSRGNDRNDNRGYSSGSSSHSGSSSSQSRSYSSNRSQPQTHRTTPSNHGGGGGAPAAARPATAAAGAPTPLDDPALVAGVQSESKEPAKPSLVSRILSVAPGSPYAIGGLSKQVSGGLYGIAVVSMLLGCLLLWMHARRQSTPAISGIREHRWPISLPR